MAFTWHWTTDHEQDDRKQICPERAKHQHKLRTQSYSKENECRSRDRSKHRDFHRRLCRRQEHYPAHPSPRGAPEPLWALAALPEHLQECRTEVKENTDTTLGWPQLIYFKACYLSFWSSIRTVCTCHTKAPLSQKNLQQNPSGSRSDWSSFYHSTTTQALLCQRYQNKY